MGKRHLFIGIFAVAIIVLLIVQYQYLRIGLSLARNQFNDKLEKAEDVISKDLRRENKLTFLMGEALGKPKYFNFSQDSLVDASNNFLRDELRKRLAEIGLPSDFTFKLKDSKNNTLLHSPDTLDTGDPMISYRINIEGYLPEILNKSLFLDLNFKDLNGYFLSQLNGLTFPTILCIIAICVVAIWFFSAYYGQKKLITTTNDFINNLTHELKTPVFSIGLATKLLEEKPKDEQKPFIETIRQQLSRLNKHIDQVLKLGSLENHHETITLSKIDLYPYLQEWCNKFKFTAEQEGFDFSFEMNGTHYHLKGEPNHLENAINNILDNAKKYSEDPIITLFSYKDKGDLYIEITDNGIGIPEKELKKIFQKFYRISNGDVHKVKGYGLGLSYVDHIIRRHRGNIAIDSAKPNGTVVTIKLPLIK